MTQHQNLINIAAANADMFAESARTLAKMPQQHKRSREAADYWHGECRRLTVLEAQAHA